MKIKEVLQSLKWTELPIGWKWAENNLDEELNKSYCCIAMDTAAVFDAINKDNIVISIKSDLRIMENYLDVFSNKYPLTRSISQNEIVSKIRDIFQIKSEQYKNEFSKIKYELIKGTNITNVKNLKTFIPNT